MLATDLEPYRDELVDLHQGRLPDMWPGPYGEWGSRKYLISSLDQSLRRMGLDYVDVFYSHRFDPDTPLEETMGALDAAVRSGKALYVGISNYTSEQTARAAAILRDLGTPLLINQPSYSMLNRWTEHDGLLDTLEQVGAGCIAFSPLAQGLLTDRYLGGIPADSRVRTSVFLNESDLSEEKMATIRALGDDRRAARPDAGPARAGLGAARPADDQPDHRREQRRPAGGEHRRAGQPRLHRRGAGRDRPPPGLTASATVGAGRRPVHQIRRARRGGCVPRTAGRTGAAALRRRRRHRQQQRRTSTTAAPASTGQRPPRSVTDATGTPGSAAAATAGSVAAATRGGTRGSRRAFVAPALAGGGAVARVAPEHHVRAGVVGVRASRSSARSCRSGVDRRGPPAADPPTGTPRPAPAGRSASETGATPDPPRSAACGDRSRAVVT